jgi:hypothetical protein
LGELDVDGSKVTDLSVITALPGLRILRADHSKLRTLPQRALPSLEELWIRETLVPEVTVDEFERRNPQCKVLYGWLRLLRKHVKDARRLVVWEETADEQGKHILVETADRSQIHDLLDQIVVDEAASGGHCACFGSPMIEFWGDENLLATISVHHGFRLRWSGYWVGDADLTRESARNLCAWLRDRGAPGPWEEFQEQESGRQAEERRQAAISEILPEDLHRAFREAEDEEELSEVFRTAAQEKSQLSEYCLKILGCDIASWHISEDISHAAELATEILPELGHKANSKALQRCVVKQEDRMACYGAARALYWFGRWDDFEDQVVEDALGILTRISLQHPRKENRRRIMSIIAEIPGGDELLEMILKGEIEVLPLPEEQHDEPHGFVTVHGREKGEPVDASDRAYAAWLLARLGKKEHLPEIRRLEEKAEGPDKEAYQSALQMLEGEVEE